MSRPRKEAGGRYVVDLTSEDGSAFEALAERIGLSPGGLFRVLAKAAVIQAECAEVAMKLRGVTWAETVVLPFGDLAAKAPDVAALRALIGRDGIYQWLRPYRIDKPN